MSLRYSYSTMPKLTIFVSATIVLILCSGIASAAPQNQAPDDSSRVEPWPDGPPPENMQISQPPPLPAERLVPPEARYYGYQQQLTFRLGVATEASKLSQPQDFVVGFQYMFPKFLAPKLEAGADLQGEGVGHIHAGARWIYWERGYFRPSVKAGLDVRLNGKEALATFTKFANFYLRGSAAIEYTVWNPYSLRLEAEVLAGSKILIEGTLGVSRGW